MNDQQFRRFPITLTQFLVGIAVLAGLFIAFGLNQNNNNLQKVRESEATFETEVHLELTTAVELQATLSYVQSDSYVEDYNRGEANRLLEGEVRVVPLITEATPQPTPLPLPTPDPAQIAQPWHMWWRLITDEPPPSQSASQ